MDKPHKRNIAAFSTSPFRPHGRIELWADGSVLRFVTEGPFNREALDAVRLAMLDLFATMPAGQRFVILLEVRVSWLCSPDVLQAFGDFLRGMTAAGRAPLAVAFVVAPEVEGRSVMLPLISRVYADNGRDFAVFETEAAAEQWLRERLHAAPI